MPRARKPATTIELDGEERLPGMEDMDRDPEPVVRRGRPRKAAAAPVKAAGNRGRIATRAPTGKIMSKAQMRAKALNEVEMYLALMAGGWELRDPECAEAATPERLQTIADRITNMIARNEKMLATVANSGVIGDIVAILHAVWPIARTVWITHGPGGRGHGESNDDGNYATRYPAYAGTGAA